MTERVIDSDATTNGVKMTKNEVVAADAAEKAVASVVLYGDLSKLTDVERVNYHRAVCESLGINPITEPFAYIRLNGKLKLYAQKACTDQLRKLYGVSVVALDRKMVGDDLLVVEAKVQDKTGRTDCEIGALSLKGLAGENLANAMMKCVTKAKRRATLSICGLGMLDETEVDSIPHAQPVSQIAESGAENMDAMLGITELKTKVKALEKDIQACSDVDEITALVEHSRDIIDACKKQLPTWYHDRGDWDGLATQIESRKKWLESKQHEEPAGEPPRTAPPADSQEDRKAPPPDDPPGTPIDEKWLWSKAGEIADTEGADLLKSWFAALTKEGKAALKADEDRWGDIKARAMKTDKLVDQNPLAGG